MTSSRFWGKFYQGPNGVLVWHPLEAHLADVAACFEALLCLPSIRLRVEIAAGKKLYHTQIQRLSVLAALHDLGKYAPGFQAKIDNSLIDICGHIQCLPGLLGSECTAKFQEIWSYLVHWFENQDEAHYFLNAIFSHHGKVMELEGCSTDWYQQNRLAGKCWQERNRLDPWSEMRELNRWLAAWFPAAYESDAPPLPGAPPLQHLLAGLVMLADWLGSDTRFFPFCGQEGRPQEGDPMPFARKAAAKALKATGLDITDLRQHTQPNFGGVFPFEPNQIQSAMGHLPLDDKGSLFVLEAATGQGKTEAALIHFVRLFWAGLVDGLYFANPLRLAATQIHDRLVGFAAKLTDKGSSPPVVLAVPGYLRVDRDQGKRLPGYQVLWLDDDDPLRTMRGWACEHPKRFLSASLAAGTIDQALLATMRTPHAHLRAAGLSRSLLVVDEVHASDRYMIQLLKGILRFMARVGGHVLLMSATLGQAARQELLRAWNRDAVDSPSLAYPLISCPGDHASLSTPDQTPPSRIKRVNMEPRAWQADHDQLAQYAALMAERGAAVAILRNSVALAQATQLALEKALARQPGLLFGLGGIPAPHHSRFSPDDRRLLDRQVVSRFGKGSIYPQRGGVVVATQTLEQSLDLDFDVLITDLCPGDVLLQRIGRLHRHERYRPEGFSAPLCMVLTPETGNDDWLLSKAAKRFGYGLDRPYEDARGILATWRKLDELATKGQTLDVPDMNREMVEAACDPDALDALAQTLGESWQKHGQEIEGIGVARDTAAVMQLVDWSQPFESSNVAGRSEQNSRVRTRLGLDDREIRFSEAQPGPFGQTVTSLKVPSWMLGKGESPEEIVSGWTEEQDIHFNFAGRAFVYDRLGLRLKEDYGCEPTD